MSEISQRTNIRQFQTGWQKEGHTKNELDDVKTRISEQIVQSKPTQLTMIPTQPPTQLYVEQYVVTVRSGVTLLFILESLLYLDPITCEKDCSSIMRYSTFRMNAS